METELSHCVKEQGGCAAAEIYNCMLMITEVNSKTHMDFSSAESEFHCSNVPYFLPDGL